MKVFLDTNVVVDFCAVREPFFRDSAIIIDMVDKGIVDMVISTLSFINIAYILRKQFPKQTVMTKLGNLMDLGEVSPIDREMVRTALDMQAVDFEDSIQYLSAVRESVDLIITRDKNGFKDFPLPVLTPRQFLDSCMR